MDFDAVVIGGGVIGTSLALELQKSGYNSVLIEKNKFLGEGVSSRNSGVIHSGIYYPKDSLKSQLTYSGNRLLYDYAHANDVPYKRTGKVIFGFDSDKARLEELIKNGKKNGVEGLYFLNQTQIHDLEPNLNKNIKMGIHSKNTGIIDVPALISSFANNFEKANGLISKNSSFEGYEFTENKHSVKIKTGNEVFKINSKILVFATGLDSFNIGRTIPKFYNNKFLKKINLTKGHYFKILGAQPFQNLVYPLPGKYGLGIHYTLDISGSVKFGPDAMLTDSLDYTFSPGVKEKFNKAISEYWQEISAYELHEDYVGIRPKIQEPKTPFQDFSVLDHKHHGIKKMIFLQGIESPGLTCCMSLAKYLVQQLDS